MHRKISTGREGAHELPELHVTLPLESYALRLEKSNAREGEHDLPELHVAAPL